MDNRPHGDDPEVPDFVRHLSMTSEATDDGMLKFIPVPLATGTHMVAEEGGRERVQSCRIIVEGVDGARREIPLELRGTSWWLPEGIPEVIDNP